MFATSPTLSPTPSQTSFPQLQTHSVASSPPTAPSEQSSVIASPSPIHSVSSSSEYNLKVQSLQTLVMVLRSLVAWSQQGIAATIESNAPHDDGYSPTPTDESPRAATPNPAAGGRSNNQGEAANPAQLLDDPEQFESLKYRKTALQDAIQRFNYKPKKVIFPSNILLTIGR